MRLEALGVKLAVPPSFSSEHNIVDGADHWTFRAPDQTTVIDVSVALRVFDENHVSETLDIARQRLEAHLAKTQIVESARSVTLASGLNAVSAAWIDSGRTFQQWFVFKNYRSILITVRTDNGGQQWATDMVNALQLDSLPEPFLSQVQAAK